MSLNLNHEDLWNDLYEWAVSHNKETAAMMEELDPRLTEDEVGVGINCDYECTND